MSQHDQQAEGIQKMIVAYMEMRKRLNRIHRAIRRCREASTQRWLNRVDRDLERFHCKIVRLSLQVAQPRQPRSERRYLHACSPPDSPVRLLMLREERPWGSALWRTLRIMSNDECTDFDDFSAADSDIHSTLLDISSVFERLIYIVSWANRKDSGETASSSGRQVLAKEHLAAFEEWLRLSLEQKLEDLKTCAHRQRRLPHELVLRWLRPRCYETLMPAGALPAERELFRMDLETLLPILAHV